MIVLIKQTLSWENWYLKDIICRNPRTSMKVQLISQDKTSVDENFCYIRFCTKVEVWREIYKTTFSMLIAEASGYLGMINSVSLLDLKWIRPVLRNAVFINWNTKIPTKFHRQHIHRITKTFFQVYQNHNQML